MIRLPLVPVTAIALASGAIARVAAEEGLPVLRIESAPITPEVMPPEPTALPAPKPNPPILPMP